MPRKAKQQSASLSIGGNVDTGGGDIAAGDIKKGNVIQSRGLQAADIKELFSPVYQKIDQKQEMPEVEREDLKVMVAEIEQEAAKGTEADESIISRHLRNIARMAPDILDVTLKTIANPVLGLATLAQKIAAKAGNAPNAPEPPIKKKLPPQ
jgi:cell division septum initiation protein DivIVA